MTAATKNSKVKTQKSAAVPAPIAAFFAALSVRSVRTLAEFAADEITLPDGPYKDQKFAIRRAPFTGLILAEYQSAEWRRFFIAGPVQSGKTLIGLILILSYILFELEENVILGVPDLALAQGIWEERIMPFVRLTRYRELLPLKGAGSRGGKVRDSIIFRNGVILRFMGAGGGDAQRSSYPARVVILTELDKMDRPGAVSRETDPTRQVEARTTAFGSDGRIYGECTVSIPEGKIWREVMHIGSGARIFIRCPKCGKYLYPEREQFRGWDQPTVGQAIKKCYYQCQHCDAHWTEADRQEALQSPLLVHKTQCWEGVKATACPDFSGEETRGWPPDVDMRCPTPGRVAPAPLPDTHTFGLQYNMMHSAVVNMADIADRHWVALMSDRNTAREDGEREICQHVWAMPYTDNPGEEERLTTSFVIGHAGDYLFRGVPPEAEFVTTGIDIQKFWIYSATVAWRRDFTGWVVSWSTVDIVPKEKRATTDPTNGMVRAALDAVYEKECTALGARGVWVDCNYDLHGWVKAWCAEHDDVFPLRGRGHHQMERMVVTGKRLRLRRYRADDGATVHARRQPDRSIMWFVDADELRKGVHGSLRIPLGLPGCMWFPGEIRQRQNEWVARHICAEQFLAVRKPGKGLVKEWTTEGRAGRHDINDCLGYARGGAQYEFSQMLAARASGTAPPARASASSGGAPSSPDAPPVRSLADRRVRRRKR